MKTVAIIPARFQSSRLPGKPLALIGDEPMILHVIKQCEKAKLLQEVWVATDHHEIYSVVKNSGFRVVMTSELHESGTDRVAEANRKIGADIVINVQGDEPFIQPKTIDLAIQAFSESPEIDISTLATRFTQLTDIDNPNFPKVVLNHKNEAIFFSRSVIPFSRDEVGVGKKFPYLRHVGLYGYRKNILERLSLTKPVELELTEKLEQLRALYYGMKIKVIEINELALSVDTAEDLEYANAYYKEKEFKE